MPSAGIELRNEEHQARYAIYFVPEQTSPLWAFGSSVLGYDAIEGVTLDFPAALAASDLDWQTLTEEPRRYGFHATLKPPFELADGASEDALVEAARNFAAHRQALALAPLEIARPGQFLALVPSTFAPTIAALAADCVTELDDFRAPLSDRDRARRQSQPLTPRQSQNLERWGYPWVLDDFAFHMTLTGPVPPDIAERALPPLQRLYEPARGRLTLDAITVVKQATRASRFVVMKRLAFAR